MGGCFYFWLYFFIVKGGRAAFAKISRTPAQIHYCFLSMSASRPSTLFTPCSIEEWRRRAGVVDDAASVVLGSFRVSVCFVVTSTPSV